jgi:FkbH-like protein
VNESADPGDRLRSDQVLRKVVNSLYKGVLERPPSSGGMTEAVKSLLDAPDVCEEMAALIKRMLGSPEYQTLLEKKHSDRLSTEEFLVPSRLRLTETKYSRILLIGSCLSEEFSKSFSSMAPGVPVDHVLFNNVADLPPQPPQPVESYTIQVLQLPLRHLLTDAIVRFKNFLDSGKYEAVIDNATAALDAMLETGLKYNREHGLLTAVTNFVVPVTPVAVSLRDEGSDFDIASMVRLLNEHLRQRLKGLKNVYPIDLDAIAGALGKEQVLDDWFHLFAHNATFFGDWTEGQTHPFYTTFERIRVNDFRPSGMLAYFRIIFRYIDRIVRVVNQTDQVKLVIFDLDNTLWRGQIAEHYRDESEDYPMAVGWPEGLAEAIHHLRARGILVAICSKNDEEVVKARFDRAHHWGFVGLDDFVVKRINWRPKPVNIADILAETSLTPRSVVFVDDNPVERMAVKEAFTAMRTIGENPFLTRSILLRAPETQVTVVTNESNRRESMIRSQIDRERQRAVMSREDFLKGLNGKVGLVTIIDAGCAHFARAFELINKTNQFNTTGKRWTQNDANALFAAGGRFVAFRVSDKFTDYGLVGVVIVKGDAILQFVMSCRVLGLEIERALLSVVLNTLREAHDGAITAEVVQTNENMVSRDVFEKYGFVRESCEEGVMRYVFVAAGIPGPPAHLRIDTSA